MIFFNLDLCKDKKIKTEQLESYGQIKLELIQ
jgi:hypothetical protein